MLNLATYSVPIFRLLLEAVYPVGMIKVQLCFMRKSAYNSFIVDQIYPKIDTGICL